MEESICGGDRRVDGLRDLILEEVRKFKGKGAFHGLRIMFYYCSY
jgi:hypothetical protein